MGVLLEPFFRLNYPFGLRDVQPDLSRRLVAQNHRRAAEPDSLIVRERFASGEPQTRAIILACGPLIFVFFQSLQPLAQIVTNSLFVAQTQDLALKPWTVDNGLITPTMKLRRGQILQYYGGAIAALYAES